MSAEPQPQPNGHKPATAKDVLDLDTLEREGTHPGPFQFLHDGRTFQLRDPQEIDWQELLLGVRNPMLFIRYAMSDEDQKAFLAAKIPAWKMNVVLEKYQEHFSLPSLGELSALLRS